MWLTSDFNQLAVNTLNNYDPKQAPFLTLVYGPAGLGKTELLRSCFQRLKKQRHVIYIDAQEFSNRFAYAAQEGGLKEFRGRIRSTSLLIFDHLEKLKGKKLTLEEFLHTYETLFERDAKIIVGFQGKTSELESYGEKLSSRLLSGLTLPIVSPTESEMLDYLTKYSRSRYLIIKDKVLEMICSQVKNFLEAQEYIQNFVRYADRNDEALEEESFLKFVALKDIENGYRLTPENIVLKVAQLTELEPAQIYGDQRVAQIREARQLAMYAIRTLCELSYPEIGRYFNKAHSAIIKSCQQFQGRMKKEQIWEDKYNELVQYFSPKGNFD